MASYDKEPLIKKNQQLQNYYNSLESKIGYELVLGGTRHFGYYASNKYWPFPIGKALRAMEDKLLSRLELSKGSKLLDAGCGDAFVAMHFAKQGYQVEAVEYMPRHVRHAQRNVKAAGLESKISIRRGDYHHLDYFPKDSFDGIYTMETLVHAAEPEVVVAEFFHVLRPGGRIALHEYEHREFDKAKSKDAERSWREINKFAAMPSNDRFTSGTIQGLLEEAGFVDVVQEDLTENVMPMVRFFFIVAYIPYLIVKLFGLEEYFINTVSGVAGYRHRDVIRYISISASKPMDM